jgi:hypothetical protein
MIDLHYNTLCDPSVDLAIVAAFEAHGIPTAPAIVRPEFGEHAIPGLKWSTVLSRRGGRGTPPSVPEIELVISFFLGGVVTTAGAKASGDLYDALKRGVMAIIGRIVKSVTIEVVAAYDDVVIYEVPPNKREAAKALEAVPQHKASLKRSDRPVRFTWDKETSSWHPAATKRRSPRHRSKIE